MLAAGHGRFDQVSEPGWRCLIDLHALSDPGAKGIQSDDIGGDGELLVVRKGSQVYVYANHCPHTGVSLNWMPDQFLDINSKYIQCSTHGALFGIEDGLCVRGPCVGRSLTAIPIMLEGTKVMVKIIDQTKGNGSP